MNGSSALRFAADKMLGSLAKKLRLLGIDTAYLNDADDGRLKYIARSQNRILLTKNSILAASLGRSAWMVGGGDVWEEFSSIAGRLSAFGHQLKPFSLCLDCGGLLDTVDPSGLEGKVPPYILSAKTHFSRCCACKKVFWEGSHRKRMEEEVERMRELIGRT